MNKVTFVYYTAVIARHENLNKIFTKFSALIKEAFPR